MQRRKIPLDFLSGGGDIALDGVGFAAAAAPESLECVGAQLLHVFCAADDADAVAGFIGTGQRYGDLTMLCHGVAQLPVGVG